MAESRVVNVMGRSVSLAETANQYSKSRFPDFMRHLIGNFYNKYQLSV